MRNLIVCNIVSLDGFYSGLGGNLGCMPFDAGFSDYNLERLKAADTLLLGRTTFEMFRSYWPNVAGDSNQPPLEREISRLNTGIDKLVVSDSLRADQLEGWGPARVVSRAASRGEIAKLKRESGRDILVFGSHVLWNDLLGAGLVDEFHLMIGPGIVGAGIRAFEAKQAERLRLLGARQFEGSGLLLARYRVEH